MLTDSYLMAVAARIGVPEIWREDACQEMRVAIWQDPNAPEKTVVHNEAVDFLRKITHRNHQHYEYLEEWHDRESPDWTLVSDRCIDLLAIWQRPYPCQRRAIIKQILGYKVSNSEMSMATQGRRKLRDSVD